MSHLQKHLQHHLPKPRLALGAAALTGVLVLAAPLAASAHVHVDPQTATAGAKRAALSFTVPNESASATTTRVSVALPAAADLTRVKPGALAGWTAEVVEADGRATRVDWAATGSGIGDGESVDFPLVVGPVPDTGRVEFAVAQTYSDGTVVEWDDPTPASGEEPEHPAPTLYIDDTPPAEDDDHDAAADGGTTHATTTAAVTDGTSTAALVLAGSALAVSVVAVVLAGVALLRRRRA